MSNNRTFGGLIISIFLMMSGVGMIVALLPQRIIEITGSGDSVGFLASAFAISYILFQIPIGNLADKIGFKIILVCGYSLCSVAGILFFYSDKSYFIFIGRFIQGLGEVPVWALAPALLSIKYPLMKGKAIGAYNAAFHMGLTIGPVLGILLQHIWPNDRAFLLYGVLCLAGAMVVQTGVEEGQVTREKSKTSLGLKHIIAILSNRIALLTLLGITLYGVGYGSFITVVPVFLISIKGFSSVYLGAFFSMFYIAISISQFLTGPMSDKFGRMKFMISGLMVAAISIAVFPLLLGNWTILVLSMASLGFGTFYLSSMAYLNEMVSDSFKGTISGAYFLFWGIGYFLGPLIISSGEKYLGSGRGFYLFSLLIFIEAVVLLSFYKYNSTKKIDAKKGYYEAAV